MFFVLVASGCFCLFWWPVGVLCFGGEWVFFVLVVNGCFGGEWVFFVLVASGCSLFWSQVGVLCLLVSSSGK